MAVRKAREGRLTGLPRPAVLAGACFAAMALAGAVLAGMPAGHPKLVLADGLVLASAAVGGACCLWRLRNTSQPRPWRFMVAAAASALLAETYWFTTEALLHRTPPKTSLSDLFYGLSYLYFLLAFLSFFPRGRPRDLARRVMDAAIIGLALFAIVWLVFLRGLVERAGATLLDSAIVSSYPALDVGIATVLLVLAAEVNGVHRQRALVMALGLTCFMATSLWHAYQEVGGSHSLASPWVLGWVAGYAAFAVAALLGPPAADRPLEVPLLTRASAYIVYAPLAGLLAVAAWNYAFRRTLDAPTFVLGTMLVVVLTLRQGLLTSDMRTAAMRLQESDRRLREAQGLARLGSWRLDVASGRRSGDPVHNRNWGFPPDQGPLERQAILARVHPDDRALLEATTLDQGAPARQEADHRVVWPDGSVHWLHEIGEPVLDGSGRLVAVAGTSQDVTDRKEQEDALHRTQARLAGILDNQDALIVRVDPDDRITYMNEAYQKAFGLRPGDTFWVKVHPEDVHRAQAAMRLLAQPPYRCTFEQRCLVGGEWRWVVWQDSVVRDAKGAIVEIQAVGFDVTERHEAQQRLQALNAELSAVVSAAPLPIVELDAAGRVLTWNAAAERTFGWTAAEAVGQSPPMIPRRALDRFMADLRRLRGGESITEEVRPVCRDGRALSVRLHVAPLLDAQGQYRGCVALLDDLTEARNAEDELRAARERERTLHDITEFKTRFLNTAAHELATPLTPLKLQLASLRSGFVGPVSDRQSQALRLLDRNLDRLGRLVNDLLDAARLQSGALRLVRHQIDLNEIAADAAESLRPQAAEEGLSLALATHGPLVADVDPDRIHQVLFNLLHNAVKFTPRGGSVGLHVERDGREAVLRVRDSGAGLTPQQMGRLFEPFTQVHDPSMARKGGTGLGLYVCRGIAEQHGGTLTVESAGPGQGAAFTLRLPLQARAAPPPSGPAQVRPVPQPAPARPKGRRR